MKQTLKKIITLSVCLGLAAAFVIGGTSWLDNPQSVNAGASDNFNGYAWSDMPTGSNEVPNAAGGTVGRGAGWISFNNITTGDGVNYGVNATPVGSSGVLNISGNAWSQHVGWISFDNVSGCPSGTCQPRIETIGGNRYFRGWARAMAYTDANAGGWDGWISFSSTNHPGTIDYGWTLNPAGNVSGYAWGGDVLGWIVPQGLTVTKIVPTLELVANPATIQLGNPLITNLTYRSPTTPAAALTSSFSSCTLTTTPSSGTVPPGSINAHNKTMPGDYPLPLATFQPVGSGVAVFNPANNQTVYTLTCTPIGGGPNVVATATVTIVSPTPSAQISAPSCVATAGSSAQLVWSSVNVDTCSISPSIGNVPLNGNQAVPVSVSTTYTLSCTGAYGNASSTATIAVNPNCQVTNSNPGGTIIPIFEEI